MKDAPPIRRITTHDALAELIESSESRPVWLLKHSLVCPLSAEGLREFERFIADSELASDAAIVEVQTAREISDEVVSRMGVRHETPQALLVFGGEARWHASHWTITAKALGKADEQLRAAGRQTSV